MSQRAVTPLPPPHPWHRLTGQEVCEWLGTRQDDGLTEMQVRERLTLYGPNTLPRQVKLSLVGIFLYQFKSPLIYILLLAAGVAFFLQDVRDAVFILLAVFLNALLGTIQEWKAEQSAQALQKLITAKVRVVRDGCPLVVGYEDLVPGDIVLLESGNRIPADIRMLTTHKLTVDESLLTGESFSVEKCEAPLPQESLPLTERKNMVYAGSIVARGRGQGVVVATALQTELGQIAQVVIHAEGSSPPLIIRMEHFSKRIALVIVLACIVLGIFGILKGMTLYEGFLFAVALAVSAIPEGLPVALTVALSISSRRMAGRNVIVRKLSAVEGLGSCTFIVSDKTGTLTVNRQTAKAVVLPDGGRFHVTGEGYQGDGDIVREGGMTLSPAEKEQIRQLGRVGILCNEGALDFDSLANHWVYQGDEVDVAFLAFGYKACLNPKEVRKQVEVIGSIPYESERRYSAVFYREAGGAGGQVSVGLKGAWENIVSFIREETPGANSKVHGWVNEMASQGYRVLAVAEGLFGGDVKMGEAGFDESMIPSVRLLGLVCMVDPLRPDVVDAVDQCKRAGIEVAMVTGDHPETALALSKQLHIAGSAEDMMTGQLMAVLLAESPDEFAHKMKTVRVFARVSPMQKLEIVERLMALGHFVAVTGDGVNDAPALQRANIGVAMGSGSDVAKDTASIIIADDNFATLKTGVAEGRYAYANVRKVIWFLISTGAAEILIFVLALIFGMALPLLPVQLLWANLVTNGIQDIGLAFEGGEADAMAVPPRAPGESVFNGPMIEQTLVVGGAVGVVCFGLWYWLSAVGVPEVEARNQLLLLLVLSENFTVLGCRSETRSIFRIPVETNYPLVVAVVVAQGVHLASLYMPVFQEVLGVRPVTPVQWGLLVMLASINLVVMEIYKVFKRRRLQKVAV